MKKWEIALAAAFVLALLLSPVLAAEKEICGSLTRLHVVANSDSEEDQALKMRVRDAVLAASAGFEAVTPGLLQEMQAAAESVCPEYPVAVTCGEEWSLRRDYDFFSLPAGKYTAVRVTIGEGRGHNFWCVVFPPLCSGVSEKELSQRLSEAGLSKSDFSVICRDGTVYKARFALCDLLGRLLGKIKLF